MNKQLAEFIGTFALVFLVISLAFASSWAIQPPASGWLTRLAFPATDLERRRKKRRPSRLSPE